MPKSFLGPCCITGRGGIGASIIRVTSIIALASAPAVTRSWRTSASSSARTSFHDDGALQSPSKHFRPSALPRDRLHPGRLIVGLSHNLVGACSLGAGAPMLYHPLSGPRPGHKTGMAPCGAE